MAPSSWLLLATVLILTLHLTEPKDGYRSVSKLRRSRIRVRRTYTTYNTYTYSTGSHGQGLSWWQIALIIGGILFAFLLLYICVRMCRNSEPESDTPGINTTRDQIQLRDHQTINHFPVANYAGVCRPNGHREVPPPVVPVPHQTAYQPVATAPPPSYDDSLIIPNKPLNGDEAVDQWQDEAQIDRKDFGVI